MDQDTFTFELRFSEDIQGLSYRTLKGNGAFRVTNGSIKNASRLVKRVSQRWEILVQPNSNSDVTITLSETQNCSAAGAVCAKDGRKLTNSTSARVLGPVGISVADARANENTDNSTIDFTVSLSRSSTSTITVNYATADGGSAMAGEDYTSKSGTLTFTAGETSKPVSVSILRDLIDEGNETFTLRLSNPSNAFLADGTATGTIENSDPMPSAWLARFGRTVVTQAVDAISPKMGASKENRVVIGGVEMSLKEETKGVNQWDGLHEQFKNSNDQTDRDLNNRTMTLEELTQGTSFNLSGKNESTGSTLSAWGQFASDSFKGKEGDVNLEGKVTSGFLGVDRANGQWRGGVSVSNSKGEGNFRSLKSDSVGNKGEVESSLTSVYPYFGYEFGEDRALWGILGIGEGDVTLTQKNRSNKADISMRMGAKGPLLSQREGDVMDMNVQADGMWVQMNSDKTREMVSSESDVTRLRLMLNSSKNFNVGEEGVLTPSFQMGVRYDGGDVEEGIGLEAGGGVRYVSGGLTLEAEARKLLVHEQDKYEEWGARVAVRIDSGKQGQGLSLSIAPTWGTAASNNADRLWSAKELHTLGGNENLKSSEHQLDAEIRYGLWRPLSFLQGLLTPFIGVSLSDDSNEVYRTGARWNMAPNAIMSLGLDHTKNQKNEENVFMLQSHFRW